MDRRGGGELLLETTAHQVVETEGALPQIEFQKRESIQALGQLFGVERIGAPEKSGLVERNVDVLGEDREVKATLLFGRFKQVEADLDGFVQTAVALGCRAAVEDGEPFHIERAIDVLQGAGDGIAAGQALTERAASEFEHERPVTEASGELLKGREVGGLISERDEQHIDCLVMFHLRRFDAPAFGSELGCDLKLTGSDEADAGRAAAQKGLHVRRGPDVIDHDETVPVLQTARDFECGIFFADECWALAGEGGVYLG